MSRQGSTWRVVLALLVGVCLGSAFTAPLASAPGKKIRRTMLMNFKATASPADVQMVLDANRSDGARFASAGSVVVGHQINKSAAYQYGVSMDFDSEDALKRYSQDEGRHQTHQKFTPFIDQFMVAEVEGE